MTKRPQTNWRNWTDLLWPSLESDAEAEARKLEEQKDDVRRAVAALSSDEDELKRHLADSEKFVEAERARKAGIESRLLNAAGLVSIAGTVVLGALLSLAGDKVVLDPPFIRAVLAVGAFYLALQLVSALHNAVKGLQATTYGEDLPHDLLPRPDVARAVHLRERIGALLERSSEHRFVNNGKLNLLNLAHCGMRNFLWGLLALAAVACMVSVFSPVRRPEVACPPQPTCGPAVAPDSAAQLPQPSQPIVRGVPPFAGRDEAWPAVGWIVLGSSVFALGLALLAVGTGTQRIIGAGLMTIGMSIGVHGVARFDGTLFKIDKLIGELKVQVGTQPTAASGQAYIRRMVTIGPFPDGDHLLPQEPVATCIAKALDKYSAMGIGGWEIVGRVDKRQLKLERAAIYGSNQALAMARANWVAQLLRTSLPSQDLSHAVIMVGGARGVGTSVASNDLQSDRAVDIFVMVNANTSSAVGSKLPEPAICPPVAAK